MVQWQSFSLYSNAMMAYLEHETEKVKNQHSPPIKPDAFAHFDALHYGGYRYLDAFFENLPDQPMVLDIGAGIGGPARHVAEAFHAQVTAIDPLVRYNQLHQSINQLCELEDRITVVKADAGKQDLTSLPVAERGFDAIYALLSFLHIADKNRLLSNCYQVLKPGGKLYIEDWAIQDDTPFTPEEAEARERVGMQQCLTQTDYQSMLKNAGFGIADFCFRSTEWSQYVWERGEALLNAKDTLLSTYGREWWDTWSTWGAEYALYAFHDLRKPLTKVNQQFPNILQTLGEDKVAYFTQGAVKQKFGGAYILASA